MNSRIKYFLSINHKQIVVDFLDWRYFVIYEPNAWDRHDGEYPWFITVVGLAKIGDTIELVEDVLYGTWLKSNVSMLYNYFNKQITKQYYDSDGNFKMPYETTEKHAKRIQKALDDWK